MYSNLKFFTKLFEVVSPRTYGYVLFGCSGGALAAAYIYANRSTPQNKKKKRVVVLGTGLAGTTFLKRLDNTSYEVQAILPPNEFPFTTPPLPSVNMVKKV